jgi:hypothetical protein
LAFHFITRLVVGAQKPLHFHITPEEAKAEGRTCCFFGVKLRVAAANDVPGHRTINQLRGD